MQTPNTSWHQAAAALKPDGRLFVNGQRRNSMDEQTFDCVSPLDGKTLCKVARGQAADVDAAVMAARHAFSDGRWSKQSPTQRKHVLLKFAAGIEAARDELALLETLDMGKPISAALHGDAPHVARCIAYYAEAIDKVYGEIAPTGSEALALITREPLGVIAAIVPWNYPMGMAAWKLGPALAAGNSVVLKPSERSPLTAVRLAEIAIEAGLPEGVFNVVTGYGGEAGEALALHPEVDAIGFTGSTRTGRRMLEYSARSNLKRVYNELGGKSPAIIFSDCADAEHAGATIAGSVFYNMGESCNAPTRLLVHDNIIDRVLDGVAKTAMQWQPADPLNEKTLMGALVDEAHLKTVMDYIDSGINEGARLVIGGHQTLAETGGCYLEPTVFCDVNNRMTIAQEEIFGPVMSIIRFRDEAEAISIANDTTYGLHASVWSDNIHRAHRVAAALRAGTVHVNTYDEDDLTVPFGGYKQSGNSRDKSLHALEKYTETKVTWLRINPA